jgi:hypothetical protein
MLLLTNGPADRCPLSCLPSGSLAGGNSCEVGSLCFQPQQVQHGEMLRLTMRTVKLRSVAGSFS